MLTLLLRPLLLLRPGLVLLLLTESWLVLLVLLSKSGTRRVEFEVARSMTSFPTLVTHAIEAQRGQVYGRHTAPASAMTANGSFTVYRSRRNRSLGLIPVRVPTEVCGAAGDKIPRRPEGNGGGSRE